MDGPAPDSAPPGKPDQGVAQDSAPACVPQSDAEFCAGRCAQVTDTDNCGKQRTVDCGPCPIGSKTDLIAWQVPLRIAWRYKGSGADHVDTNTLCAACSQVYYLPDKNAAARQPLYRLFNGVFHMPSSQTTEANYTQNGTLGYPWKAADKPPGAVQIFRGFNLTTGDHALMSPANQLSGYKQELFALYGYPRYAQHQLRCLKGSKLELCSNLNAGGAIWTWTLAGMQYVNDWDFGRQIQASLNVYGALPTEGGDQQRPSGDVDSWHGSPLHSHAIAGKTQKTRAIPLEWFNDRYNGGSYDPSGSGPKAKPVIYAQWRLGKDVTVDPTSFDLGSYNYLRSQIAKYVTVFYTPTGIKNAHIEIPTGYLNNNFTRFFTIDGSKADLNAALHEITQADFGKAPPTFHYQYNVQSGGVVIATADLKHAMGVYAYQAGIKYKGTLYFTLWDFLPETAKWSAAYAGEMPKGELKFTSYIIAGTLDEVRVAMRRLYMAGLH